MALRHDHDIVHEISYQSEVRIQDLRGKEDVQKDELIHKARWREHCKTAMENHRTINTELSKMSIMPIKLMIYHGW